MILLFLITCVMILNMSVAYMPPPPKDFDYETALGVPEDFESFVVGTRSGQGK